MGCRQWFVLRAAGMEMVKAAGDTAAPLQLRSFLQKPQEPSGLQRGEETFI